MKHRASHIETAIRPRKRGKASPSNRRQLTHQFIAEDSINWWVSNIYVGVEKRPFCMSGTAGISWCQPLDGEDESLYVQCV
jgi:hypothetical protein